MSLRELFDEKPERIVRVTCKTCRIIKSLQGDDLAVVLEAINDNDFSGARIASVLRKSGFDISDSAVTRHRRNCR